MLSKALVDRPVDLLAHVAGEPLPALAAGGGKLLGPFLFQALAQLGFAPSLLAVALLPFSQFAVKGAVVLAVAGGEEVGDTHIHPDHRGRRPGLDGDHLVVAQRQPPAITALVERHAGIDSFSLNRLAVAGSQLAGDQHLLAQSQRAARPPLVTGGVLPA